LSERAVEPAKARAIIEAILLTADAPVTPGRLIDLLDGFNGRDIRQAIDALNEQYQRAGHGFTIAEVGGGFQMATLQEYGPWVRKFHHHRSQVRLSQAALETLAIVAFKQPVTRVGLDSIRGVNSGGVLHTLMELGLVRLVGRSEGLGKPMLFGTTREFLIHFGLKSLADLPRPRELEELLAEGPPQAEARQHLAHHLQQLETQGAQAQPAQEDGGDSDAA
jgi:segregation and condensation protein B